MLENLLTPVNDIGLLVLRIGLAAVFFAHGLPKLQNIGMVRGFFDQMSIPLSPVAAWGVALLETLGALLLALGVGTRVLAILFALNMLVAIVTARIGLMKSAFAGGEGVGWEFEFALLVASVTLFFTGAGAYALDALLNTGL